MLQTIKIPRFSGWLAVAALINIISLDVNAQTAVPKMDAGRIHERLQDGFSTYMGGEPYKLPLIEGVSQPDSLEKSDASEVFSVREIVVLNSTVLENEEIHKQVSNAIGENISLADLQRAAFNLTSLYRTKGYAFSKAFIPPQTIENQQVVIEVIEGYVGEVEYRGIDVPEYSPIHRYAKKLAQQRPVRTQDLERYTLLINDLGGVEVRVIAVPVAQSPGAVKLVFLLDKESHAFVASLSNRGSEALGPAQSVLHYQANNLSGLGEETRLIHLRTPTNNELSFFSMSQSWPIGPQGLKLTYGMRHSRAEPGAAASIFDIESVSDAYSIGLSYPWLRTRAVTFSSFVNIDIRDSQTDSFGLEIIDDNLRYLRFGGDYRKVHSGGITDVNATFSYGLNMLNATNRHDAKASRAGASSDSHKMQLTFQRQQFLQDRWSLTLKATGQWAFDPLLSAELFGLGGSEFGRAYDFSEITGDSGFAGSLQLNYALPYETEWVQHVGVYGFVDGGYVYDDTNTVGENWQSLSSSGIGFDTYLFNHVSSKIEVAHPLEDPAGLGKTVEVYGIIGTRFAF